MVTSLLVLLVVVAVVAAGGAPAFVRLVAHSSRPTRTHP
jgi:hypothetical protein